MNDITETVGLLNDLDRVATWRHQIADSLNHMTDVLTQAEQMGEQQSGKLGLEREIETIAAASQNLRQGVFRLMVLGDMKRGKSTFLNALIGENLLPSDVKPCTALLTILKYGVEKRVTIHFNNGTAPEQIDFKTFKQAYTIDPEEANVIEQTNQPAFPTVSHVVVEHPLPLLGKGIELVDSPGLNDTEARNELSLGYIYNCQAILFVLSAFQPCTLEERRYLRNYLKGRGLSLFFLINAWDQVQSGLVDPDDPVALNEAETSLRQVFRTHLAEYCQVNGQDRYAQRVFEISSLHALRSRLKAPNGSLEGTGFPAFLAALNQFLTQDRAIAEFQQAYTIAQRACHHTQSAIERRIPLLDQTVEGLKEKIASVQSNFEQLADIGNQFQHDIRTTRDREARAIADSFKTYILNLETTFEEDFLSAQPDLDFMQFLDRNNRGMFYTAFKRAFERYINDRLAAWEFITKQKIAAAFSELDAKAADYRVAYADVLEAMNDKMLGYRFYAVGHSYKPGQAGTWADAVADLFSSIPDNLNGGIRSFDRFWQVIFFYACLSIAMQIVGLMFASLTLPFLGTVLAGIGMIVLQAEYVRQQFIETTKKEFTKYLPQIAEDQWEPIQQAIKKCFDVYESQVGDRVLADINSRRAELDNLLKQKESYEVDRETEAQRLKDLEVKLVTQLQAIETSLEA